MEFLITPATMISLIAGYFIGSVPFGFLLTWASGLGDIRSVGSGNIGATNVLRTGNKTLAAATLFLDMLKGFAATAVAFLIGFQFTPFPSMDSGPVVVEVFPWMVVCMGGLGAFLGHLFPVWLGFKGGKGVATYIGILIGTTLPVAFTFCGVWLMTAYTTRYSSISALVASLAALAVAMTMSPPHVSAMCAFITAFMFFKHRGNIKRWMNGEEPKIGESGKAK